MDSLGRRLAATWFVAVCSFMVVALGAVGRAEEPDHVTKLALDDPAEAGLVIEPDKEDKKEGPASLRVTTKWPTTVCLGQVKPDVEGGTLVYTAEAKCNLKGTAMLEMWAHLNEGVYFGRNPASAVANKNGWTTLTTTFHLKQGQKPEKITLNLIINGVGVVWVDDAKLEFKPIQP